MGRHNAIPKDFTADQAFCLNVLAEIMRGFHHVPNPKKCGQGIEANFCDDFATYDADLLTRAVVIAHRYAVRISIGASGPRRTKLMAHRRKPDPCVSGKGLMMHERHPDLDGLIAIAEAAKKKPDITEEEIAP